ncbi:hypothetical protein SAMN06272735_8948 [Streptomyces sp. TLI_55]|uniref:hypothetical protein n=1 Tax=Streptomyces sp. TLI_55 TaxID=1938861 RepID=UPI000BCFE08C|nr:hypothetical protein [Streptomyces sp. TLI_55]SNX88496.1 hypothetical protein SAMN06272735_8948 [Streptomyces sp. TLI_55]
MPRSSSFSPSRSRRLAAWVSGLTVVVVAAAVLALAAGTNLPEAWWPRTGAAFTAEPSATSQDSCDLIKGPAREYCEHGVTTSASITPPASGGGQDAAGALWPLVSAGTALAALIVWRRRAAPARERV